MLKLSDFDYYLPKELIAQYPLKKRDDARLLVLDRKRGTIEHSNFSNIGEFLAKGDSLVLNNTKVLPCRLIGKRMTGGRVEVFLIGKKGAGRFEALIKPTRVKLQERIIFNGGKTFGTIMGKREVSFNTLDVKKIYALGRMPLPPYIKRDAQELDDSYYQTVYARNEGAVAAPTAGLHFTPALIKKIRLSGVNIAELTLHVGTGTFKPVKSEDIRRHKMEAEDFQISKETLKLIERTQASGRKVFAVGTTSCRALEASCHCEGRKSSRHCEARSAEAISKKGLKSTDLFIYPGYKFKAVDCLLTNFHLPRTTLFMLVCAFAGERLIKKAYREAIEKKYRFYSYGDAMLII